MNYIELSGSCIDGDINEIKEKIDKSNEVVFVYSGKDTLYDYITALANKGLGPEYLYKFKVCYENKALQLSYFRDDIYKKITSISSLVNELNGKSYCRIVIDNDDRVQLAFIVQQLIYIEYPLEKVDILLKKEERDASKTKRFMEKIEELQKSCESANLGLTKLRGHISVEPDEPAKNDCLQDIDEVLKSCEDIKEQIEKALDVELKFAVAASKKAGKSVIVNCFIGEQIAPTSTELATPNNCFYRKSKDNYYHLKLEGDNKEQRFKSREEIYNVISKHFRNAQNNKEKGFALPNMNIDYVTEENNFSSYTIFDTAGPDAAGTSHAKVAEDAMNKCDVAVFAIDYSKYLTTSEEEYLHKVKNIFTSQNKFHSLIFALNKIDVRYTDTDSPKSFVMSVDFLKTRLAKIDEAYKDCIIFPTCSLEYFSAIEAEKAGVTELLPENHLEIEKMRDVKFKYRNVASLAWLHTHSENLEYYHGIKEISYDILKKDSGMPALMSYVSYVAKSKARDEIVNNITYKIALQKKKIQEILNYINNIEALIDADDKKIDDISKILKEYQNNVDSILDNNFKEEDLNILEDDNLLKRYGGSYEKVMEEQKIALQSDQKTLADMIYSDIINVMWDKIKNNKMIDGNKIDKLFTNDDFQKAVNMAFKKLFEISLSNTHSQIGKVQKEVKKIVQNRWKMLEHESRKCQEDLAKKDVNIKMPEMPEFEFALPLSSPANFVPDISDIDLPLYNKLEPFFKKEMNMQNIVTWFSSLFNKDKKKDYIYTFNKDKKAFINICEKKLKSDIICSILYNNSGITKQLNKYLQYYIVEEYMANSLKTLKEIFQDMNKIYEESVNRFRTLIDDREKYRKNSVQLSKRKQNILNIGNYTKKFMVIWNMIIDGCSEKANISQKGDNI